MVSPSGSRSGMMCAGCPRLPELLSPNLLCDCAGSRITVASAAAVRKRRGPLSDLEVFPLKFQALLRFHRFIHLQDRHGSFISDFGRAVELVLAAHRSEEVLQVRLVV